MPDSMNYMNDPNAMPQQGSMQGWDPAYAAQMQDPAYLQAMYGQDPMAAQAMYGNQMPQQGYPGYGDPMAQQAMYGDPNAYMQQGGYYQDPAYLQQGYENPEQPVAMDYGMQQQVQQPQNAQMGMQSAGVPQQAAQPTQAMGAPAPMTDPQAAQVAAQQQAQAAMQPPAMPMQAPKNMKPPSKGQATASLIMGIFSIVLAIFPPLGIFLGWFSGRLAKKYIRAGGTSAAADSGKIFGKVGYFFSFLMLMVLIFLVAYVAGATFGNYGARAVAIYYNNSPLGKLFGILPL